MGNRIVKWWNDVIAWKERFEKLFPPSFLKSKDFQSAEMKKLEKILAYPTSKLNEDERLSRKMVRQQYRQLVRTRYPNPFVRLLRNTGKLAVNILVGSASLVRKALVVIKTRNVDQLNAAEVKQFLKKDIEAQSMKAAQQQTDGSNKLVSGKSTKLKNTVVLNPDFGKRKTSKSRGV